MHAMKYRYYYLHIPSGDRGERLTPCYNRDELSRLLNQWNAQSPGCWQYWTYFETTV
jgi:hypothetical protein